MRSATATAIRHEGETFSRLYDRGEALRLRGVHLSRCIFQNCAFSLTDDVTRMSELRDVTLENCSFHACQFGPFLATDVWACNLSMTDLLILWSPYFNHVTLSGDIGRLKINATADPSTYKNGKQRPFDEFRAQFYADVDWALDISHARFRTFDIAGIPGRLVRRDPESQILITRERAQAVVTPGWEARLSTRDTHWPFSVNLFLADGTPELVLAAPLGERKKVRDAFLETVRDFRRIGLAEPS
jgi:hypothetical protein